jgi:DNA topoisomerase IA
VRSENPKQLRTQIRTTPAQNKTVSKLSSLARERTAFWSRPIPIAREAILLALCELLKDRNGSIQRILFNEITPQAILSAVTHPQTLDLNLVNAQQARRILDRLVGYQISPLLWRRVKGSTSAGRVQSVAVAPDCERDQEIRDFRRGRVLDYRGAIQDSRGYLDPGGVVFHRRTKNRYRRSRRERKEIREKRASSGKRRASPEVAPGNPEPVVQYRFDRQETENAQSPASLHHEYAAAGRGAQTRLHQATAR